MAHLSKIGLGNTLRTLATASLLAVAIISIPASQAYAEANNGPQTAGKKCINPDTGKRDIPGGTDWTSTTQNGQVASKYTCNGTTGEWDKVTGPPITVSNPHVPMGGGVLGR